MFSDPLHVRNRVTPRQSSRTPSVCLILGSINNQHDRREHSVPVRQAMAEPVENLGPDSGGGSVQLVSVHFDGNYELPLQAV
jgi:hypothetical protein